MLKTTQALVENNGGGQRIVLSHAGPFLKPDFGKIKNGPRRIALTEGDRTTSGRTTIAQYEEQHDELACDALAYICLYCANMDESIRFYRDVLGLRIERHNPDFCQFALGSTRLGLEPGGWHKRS